VALPGAHRDVDPSFAAVESVPAIGRSGGVIQVFAGSLAGAASPAPHYSEILGADVTIHPGTTLEIELNVDHEHAALVLNGDCSLQGQPLAEKNLYYLGVRRSSTAFSSRAGGRILLIGGPPFPEPILMWWNFVARTRDEIAEARADWEARRRFGDVKAYRGARLSAPDLVRFARPDPMS
jgi:hypothetical protein